VGWTYFLPEFNRPLRSLIPQCFLFKGSQIPPKAAAAYDDDDDDDVFYLILAFHRRASLITADEFYWINYICCKIDGTIASENETLQKKKKALISNNEMFRRADKERSVIVGDWHRNEPAPIVYEDRKMNDTIKNGQVYISWFQTFAVFWVLYAFFWVIPRRLNFICRCFGTLCLFHLHRRVGMKNE